MRPALLIRLLAFWLACGALAVASLAYGQGKSAPGEATTERLIELGPGDSINLQVYGQPDMTTTVYVSDDGTIPVALVGAVKVAGLSPAEAADRVQMALKEGRFLLDPHVTINVVQSRSQRISVLGEVKAPGRYPVESNTSIIDLLAQAGGTTQNSSDVIYILRTDKAGTIKRLPVNLTGLSENTANLAPTETLRAGDSVFVPKAEQFSIYGEVATPNMYRIEPGMMIIQAIARAGGVTARGSQRRIEVKRRTADGKYKTISGKLNDLVQPGDVIYVKESIF
jgi:polysaccharide export outer membrane protein